MDMSKLLFTDTDSLVYEIKGKMFIKIAILAGICLILVIIH